MPSATPVKSVYATQPVPLRAQIRELLAEAAATDVQGTIRAIIVPDTNLVEGGRVAAQVYRALEGTSYRSVIVVAASHSGGFQRINICSLDAYRTPLGDLVVNTKIRDELCDEDDDIFVGDLGHYHTAGVDVQLPFLQTVLGGFDIVPIVMGQETPDMCRELGHAIGEIMYNRETLVVACADITRADEDGLRSLERVLTDRDVEGLMQMLNSEMVGMTGKGAVTVALLAALRRRADTVRVLSSAAPQGDRPGFIGAIISAS